MCALPIFQALVMDLRKGATAAVASYEKHMVKATEQIKWRFRFNDVRSPPVADAPMDKDFFGITVEASTNLFTLNSNYEEYTEFYSDQLKANPKYFDEMENVKFAALMIFFLYFFPLFIILFINYPHAIIT